MKFTTPHLIALALAATVALTACGKKEEAATPAAPPAAATAAQPAAPAAPAPAPVQAAVSLASIDLGSAVGPDQKVSTATTTFSPKDSIYAAVSTTGSGTATIAVKWTYQDGQTVKEDSKSIAPTGPATTSFEISKPDGWPAGNYKVDVTLNGQPAGTKDFSVK
jgi:multidrug efflux pump subunit AcrA (membrane-fusion protein)